MTTTDTTTSTAPALTWLTSRQLARRLRLHEKTLLRLAREGKLPHLRAGKAVRFPAELVEATLMRQVG